MEHAATSFDVLKAVCGSSHGCLVTVITPSAPPA
jgi:hypothetical protein